MERGKILDAVILISFFFVSTLLIWSLKLNSLITTILYLVIPSIYLLVRYPQFRKRILMFTIPFTIVSFPAYYIAEYGRAWFWNSPTVRFFTYIPLEVLFWGLGYCMIVLGIYEVFVDSRHRHPNMYKNYNWWLLFLFSFFLAFSIWILFGLPRLEYTYARFFALPVIAPIVYILVKKPHIFPRLLKISLLLFIPTLLYEIFALKLGLWGFSGEYSGFVNLFSVAIPLEEFILWVALGGAMLTAYFETFIED